MKPTFKNEPRYTGLYAVGNRSGAEIKVGGRRVGSIMPAGQGSGFQHGIQIAIKTGEENSCGWGWLMPKNKFDTLPEAKAWVKENFDAIVGGRELHFFDD